MKKALLALISVVMLFGTTQAVHAEDQKVLAIIDTAVNSSMIPSVIYEACFTYAKTTGCPNGETSMEGKGAASATWPTLATDKMWLNNKTFHGDSMVKAALAVNPNLKIVFVRVADVNSKGNSVMFSQSLVSAINWVSNNSEKYSIDALSISLSGVNKSFDVANTLTSGLTLSSSCTDTNVINSVSVLNSKNIPTFAATGNNSSKTLVGFPACIPGVTGVGALSTQIHDGSKVGETVTNRGPGLDVVAVGVIDITKYNGSSMTLSGSSGANVISASTYVKNNSYNTSEEYLSSLKKEQVKFVDYFINGVKANIAWEPVRTVSYSSN